MWRYVVASTTNKIVQVGLEGYLHTKAREDIGGTHDGMGRNLPIKRRGADLARSE